MKRHAACLLATALLLQACGGGDDPADVALVFTEVQSSASSAIAQARTVAVHDDTAWAALWAAHKAHETPPPPRPPIDFALQSVLGEVGACDRPRVDSVVLTPGTRITVQWTHVLPQPFEACIAMLGRPAQMVRFDNPQQLPLEFRQAR